MLDRLAGACKGFYPSLDILLDELASALVSQVILGLVLGFLGVALAAGLAVAGFEVWARLGAGRPRLGEWVPVPGAVAALAAVGLRLWSLPPWARGRPTLAGELAFLAVGAFLVGLGLAASASLFAAAVRRLRNGPSTLP